MIIVILGVWLSFYSALFWLVISRYNKWPNIVVVGKGMLFTDLHATSTVSLTRRRSIFYVLMNGFRFHLVSHSYWEAIVQLAKQQGSRVFCYLQVQNLLIKIYISVFCKQQTQNYIFQVESNTDGEILKELTSSLSSALVASCAFKRREKTGEM